MHYKKTFWASLSAFFIGTSCCWLSSLAIWIGGAAFLGTLAVYLENIQPYLIVLGLLLALSTIVLYLRRR